MLAEDESFVLELEKSCSTKTQEWEEVAKTRAEELVALADISKVVNDDDALELFCTGGEGSFSCLHARYISWGGGGNNLSPAERHYPLASSPMFAELGKSDHAACTQEMKEKFGPPRPVKTRSGQPTSSLGSAELNKCAKNLENWRGWKPSEFIGGNINEMDKSAREQDCDA